MRWEGIRGRENVKLAIMREVPFLGGGEEDPGRRCEAKKDTNWTKNIEGGGTRDVLGGKQMKENANCVMSGRGGGGN